MGNVKIQAYKNNSLIYDSIKTEEELLDLPQFLQTIVYLKKKR